MYYALKDWFYDNNKQNGGYGFENSKTIVCFETKKERDEWLKNRNVYDFSASEILYKEALKRRETFRDNEKGCFIGDGDKFHTFGGQYEY